MRMSQLVGRRIKEDPKDAKTVSHKFLIRGGYVRPVSAGIYSLLPLGKRIVDKIEAIIREEMNKIDAVSSGAEAMFIERYPDIVTVYTISYDGVNNYVSKEICMGPHVNKTSEIGTFKIVKEEASSAGVRRIKAKIA